MSRSVPEILNDYKIHPNGKPELLGTADIQLPDFAAITSTIDGGGILGEYETPAYGHFQSMKLTINWNIFSDEMRYFLRTKAIDLDCRLANQEFNATKGEHEFKVNRLVVRGMATKNSPGKVKKGNKYEGSTEIEVLYLKMETDGKTILEYDRIARVFKVDGEDQLADLDAALGGA